MKSVESMIRRAGETYTLTPRDTGSFTEIKINGMKFHVRSYRIENVGYLTVMTMKTLFGLVKMDTLVITGKESDIPLFCYNCSRTGGRKTVYLEIYDTCFSRADLSELSDIRQKYSFLNDYNPGEHWYDSIKLPESAYIRTRNTAGYSEFVAEYFDCFLKCTKNCKKCNSEDKNRLNDKYADGLLRNGSTAVNILIRNLGEERASHFLRKYLLSTDTDD